jgi:hypothetical protein
MEQITRNNCIVKALNQNDKGGSRSKVGQGRKHNNMTRHKLSEKIEFFSFSFSPPDGQCYKIILFSYKRLNWTSYSGRGIASKN